MALPSYASLLSFRDKPLWNGSVNSKSKWAQRIRDSPYKSAWSTPSEEAGSAKFSSEKGLLRKYYVPRTLMEGISANLYDLELVRARTQVDRVANGK